MQKWSHDYDIMVLENIYNKLDNEKRMLMQEKIALKKEIRKVKFELLEKCLKKSN